MHIYPRNRIITVVSNVNPGEGQTTVEHEWKLNGELILNNTNSVTLNTNGMPAGDNILEYRAKNSCGKWSNVKSEIIAIVEGDIMQKTVNILVDSPIEDVTVVMDYLGTVNVTVTDQLSRPVQGATVDIEGNTGTTNASGLAVISNVPYGTRTVVVTV